MKRIYVIGLLLLLTALTTSTAGAASVKTFYVSEGRTTDIFIPAGSIGEIYYYPPTTGTTYFVMKQDIGHLVASNQATVSFAWAKNRWSTYNAPWTTLYYKNSMKVKLYTGTAGICYKITVKPLSWGYVSGAHATITKS